MNDEFSDKSDRELPQREKEKTAIQSKSTSKPAPNDDSFFVTSDERKDVQEIQKAMDERQKGGVKPVNAKLANSEKRPTRDTTKLVAKSEKNNESDGRNEKSTSKGAKKSEGASPTRSPKQAITNPTKSDMETEKKELLKNLACETRIKKKLSPGKWSKKPNKENEAEKAENKDKNAKPNLADPTTPKPKERTKATQRKDSSRKAKAKESMSISRSFTHPGSSKSYVASPMMDSFQ